MTYSPEIQQDIAQHGRTLITIYDEDNTEKNKWAYSIGNSLGDTPTPELLCFFPHRDTVSWGLNELSESLRLEEIQPLAPGEVVEVCGVLGQYKEFPLLLKHLTADEQQHCWDNYTCQLSPDAPVIQVEIPDTAGYYAHDTGSPAGYLDGRTPERLQVSHKPDRFITNLWGAPQNPVGPDALRDNLRYLVSIFRSPSEGHEPHTPATLEFLHYLAEREFDSSVTDYGEPDDASELRTHHEVCISLVQTMLNHKEAIAALTAEDDGISPFGANQEYGRYWYGIKPTPEDLELNKGLESRRDDFECHYETPEDFVADLNWELIRYAIGKAYENSLDEGKTMQHRIMWKRIGDDELTAEEKQYLERKLAAEDWSKKTKRFTAAWFKNKIQSLFSK